MSGTILYDGNTVRANLYALISYNHVVEVLKYRKVEYVVKVVNKSPCFDDYMYLTKICP